MKSKARANFPSCAISSATAAPRSAGFMEQGAALAIDGDVLTVIARNDIYIRYLNDNKAVIAELASELLGRTIRVELSINGAVQTRGQPQHDAARRNGLTREVPGCAGERD